VARAGVAGILLRQYIGNLCPVPRIGGLQLHYRVAIDTSAARGLFDMFDRLMHAAQSRRIMRLSTHFQSLESLARNIFENILRPGMPCEFGTI
jgi:hypothetical protein